MPIYSVSQITRYLRESLERDSLLRDLWISGEVSNLFTSGAGNVYFTLKDENGTLRCVIFKPARGGDLLSEGASIIAHGRLSLYEARGDIQLYADLVQPEGVGELHLQLEQLKLKLEQEGLFEPSRKRPLPRFPKRIGLVTSPTGAVFHDIQNVIARRYPLVELALAPTKVQGDGAAEGIVEALETLGGEEAIDVIIVARGGGSLEELMAFNDERVAYAIYRSAVPVVSGVGHETDVTIADMVADVRAPTPSAAAEVAVPNKSDLLATLYTIGEGCASSMSRRLAAASDDLSRLCRRLTNSSPDTDQFRLRIDDLLRAATAHSFRRLDSKRERLNGLEDRLASLSPTAVLSRGYALVQDTTSSEVVSSVGQVHEKDKLRITIHDGSFGAEVMAEEPEQRDTRQPANNQESSYAKVD